MQLSCVRAIDLVWNVSSRELKSTEWYHFMPNIIDSRVDLILQLHV